MGAALLPVLYHFVRKMKAKKVPFSSLMFLRATPKELIKRRRLRDILLMTIRAFIFALLALAFARPFIPQEQIPFISQRDDQSVVILLDNSYSMQYDDLFDQAKQEVLNRLEAGGNRDEFSIIAFSDVAQQVTALSQDRAVHRNVVENTIVISNRPTDFYEPLRLAEEVLKEAQHDDKTVVLISDFQRIGWTGSLENWKLHPDITFEPVKVGQDAGDNAYVEAFNLTTKRTGDDVVIRYDARFKAEGQLADQEKRTALAIDGSQVDQRDLPALPTSQATFQQVAPREGFFQGQLALGADDLPIDDRYYFTYEVAGRPTILALDDGPRSQRQDAYFLRKAFDLGDRALYEFGSGRSEGINRSSLRGYDAVFLANVTSLSGGQVAAVQSYLESGGNVVISFGEEVDIDAFSRHLRSLGIGRIAEKITARAVQSTEAIIGDIDLRHPIFEVFSSTGRGAILRPKFRQYVRVIPDTSAIVIGSYDTGDPFLLERRVGQGKLIVYTSTFNTNWTDFPVNEMYLPFLYQLAKYAVNRGEERHQYTVGEVVALKGQPGEEWEVQTPDNELFKVAIDANSTGFFRETDTPGSYVAARGRDLFYFSVNVDPIESALATRDAEEAYAAVVSPPEALPSTPELAAALVVEDEERKQKLWKYVILLVLILFALETVLANRRVKKRVVKRNSLK